jgi:hypothetical protein
MANAYRQGEHICTLFDTEDEHVAVAAEYLAHGLRQGRRCFYVAASKHAHARLRQALSRLGVDVPNAIKTKALLEGVHADVHLADGHFDTERMLRLLNDGIEAALDDGFTGLRSCGDMSWLLDHSESHEQVVQYEAFLNELFRSTPAEAMCLYDRRRLPSGLLDHALSTHSSVIVDCLHQPNALYDPQVIAAAGQADSVGWKARELRRRP